jgi:hypothetical protein
MPTQNEYLNAVKAIYDELQELQEDYDSHKEELKIKLAETVEEGRFETDLSVDDFAQFCGIKRQTMNRFLINRYGIRHPEKSKAATLGHKSNE